MMNSMSALQYFWKHADQSTELSFSVNFTKCSRTPLDWKSEIYATARQIAQQTNKPLWLGFSGGIDSEVMCHAFLDQGIPFSVITLAHENGTNAHDIRYAKDWCAKHGIFQKIEMVDMEHFFSKSIWDYVAQNYFARNIFRYTQIKLLETIESMGGYGVLGAGEQYYKVGAQLPEINESDIFIEFNVGHTVAYEWCKRNNTSHEPFFFYGTPELCLSYMQIPIIEFALTQPDLFRHPVSTYTLKRLAYQSVWPRIRARPKYHGLEKLLKESLVVKKKLREVGGTKLQSYLYLASCAKKDLTLI